MRGASAAALGRPLASHARYPRRGVLAALRLLARKRLYPQWIAGVGLGSCLLLAVLVEPLVVMAGVLALLMGVVWQIVASAVVKQP